MPQSFSRPIIERVYIGYNDNLPPETLSSGIFAKADNVFLSDNKIAKVPGSSAIATSIAAKSFNGLGPFENLTSGNKFLIANINGASVSQAYSWNGSGAFSAISGLTSTNDSPMMFETAGDYVFGFDGHHVWDFDGTSGTKDRSGVPVGSLASWFHNYLFVAGVSSVPNRLYWSDLGAPTSFTNTNFVDINPGDGDKIVAFGTIQDQLLVFKRNTIWSITGFSGTTFSSTTIATQNTNARIVGYGAIAPFSVISTGNDVYFMSLLGQVPVIRSLKITQFATTLSGGIISHDIDGTMETLNKNVISGVTSEYDGRYCYWSIPVNGSTTNNKIVVLDTYAIQKSGSKTLYSWTTMTGKNASYMSLSTISGTAAIYFAESGVTGKVIKIDTSLHSDQGSSITMDVITRSFMPDPARKMKWKYLYLRFDTGSSGSLLVKSKVDDASDFALQDTISLIGMSPGLGPTGTFTLGNSLLGGSSRSRHRTNLLHIIGKTLQLEFLETSTSAAAIYDHEIYYQPKGLRDN